MATKTLFLLCGLLACCYGQQAALAPQGSTGQLVCDLFLTSLFRRLGMPEICEPEPAAVNGSVPANTAAAGGPSPAVAGSLANATTTQPQSNGTAAATEPASQSSSNGSLATNSPTPVNVTLTSTNVSEPTRSGGHSAANVSQPVEVASPSTVMGNQSTGNASRPVLPMHSGSAATTLPAPMNEIPAAANVSEPMVSGRNVAGNISQPVEVTASSTGNTSQSGLVGLDVVVDPAALMPTTQPSVTTTGVLSSGNLIPEVPAGVQQPTTTPSVLMLVFTPPPEPPVLFPGNAAIKPDVLTADTLPPVVEPTLPSVTVSPSSIGAQPNATGSQAAIEVPQPGTFSPQVPNANVSVPANAGVPQNITGNTTVAAAIAPPAPVGAGNVVAPDVNVSAPANTGVPQTATGNTTTAPAATPPAPVGTGNVVAPDVNASVPANAGVPQTATGNTTVAPAATPPAPVGTGNVVAPDVNVSASANAGVPQTTTGNTTAVPAATPPAPVGTGNVVVPDVNVSASANAGVPQTATGNTTATPAATPPAPVGTGNVVVPDVNVSAPANAGVPQTATGNTTATPAATPPAPVGTGNVVAPDVNVSAPANAGVPQTATGNTTAMPVVTPPAANTSGSANAAQVNGSAPSVSAMQPPAQEVNTTISPAVTASQPNGTTPSTLFLVADLPLPPNNTQAVNTSTKHTKPQLPQLSGGLTGGGVPQVQPSQVTLPNSNQPSTPVTYLTHPNCLYVLVQHKANCQFFGGQRCPGGTRFDFTYCTCNHAHFVDPTNCMSSRKALPPLSMRPSARGIILPSTGATPSLPFNTPSGAL